MKERKVNKLTWLSVILVFFLFFPVGIVILVIKLFANKKLTLISEVIFKLIGVTLILLGLLGFNLIYSLSKPSMWEPFLMFAFLGSPGIYLLIIVYKFKNDIELTKDYIYVIVNEEKRNIKEISEMIGKSYEDTLSDIRFLVKKGYFPNSIFDLANENIILPEIKNKENKLIHTCHICGAKNYIDIYPAKCLYCESKLKE